MKKRFISVAQLSCYERTLKITASYVPHEQNQHNTHGLTTQRNIYSLADLFNRTPYPIIWEAFSHTTINAQNNICMQISTTAYVHIRQSDLEPDGVSEVAQSSTR